MINTTNESWFNEKKGVSYSLESQPQKKSKKLVYLLDN